MAARKYNVSLLSFSDSQQTEPRKAGFTIFQVRALSQLSGRAGELNTFRLVSQVTPRSAEFVPFVFLEETHRGSWQNDTRSADLNILVETQREFQQSRPAERLF